MDIRDAYINIFISSHWSFIFKRNIQLNNQIPIRLAKMQIEKKF